MAPANRGRPADKAAGTAVLLLNPPGLSLKAFNQRGLCSRQSFLSQCKPKWGAVLFWEELKFLIIALNLVMFLTKKKKKTKNYKYTGPTLFIVLIISVNSKVSPPSFP